MTTWILFLILLALTFDFLNGFHDSANSIATVVSTRVLSPGKAVIWAAFFNFVAAFVFGTAVAKTVGSGMIDIKIVTFAVVFGGLTGAIVWDLITWYFGLPTSSSHALIGGMIGAALADPRGWPSLWAAPGLWWDARSGAGPLREALGADADATRREATLLAATLDVGAAGAP